jgi:hypothetical protein
VVGERGLAIGLDFWVEVKWMELDYHAWEPTGKRSGR